MLANIFFIVNLLIKDVNSQAALVNMEERMEEFKFCHKVCPEILKVFSMLLLIYYQDFNITVSYTDLFRQKALKT